MKQWDAKSASQRKSKESWMITMWVIQWVMQWVMWDVQCRLLRFASLGSQLRAASAAALADTMTSTSSVVARRIEEFGSNLIRNKTIKFTSLNQISSGVSRSAKYEYIKNMRRSSPKSALNPSIPRFTAHQAQVQSKWKKRYEDTEQSQNQTRSHSNLI